MWQLFFLILDFFSYIFRFLENVYENKLIPSNVQNYSKGDKVAFHVLLNV